MVGGEGDDQLWRSGRGAIAGCQSLFHIFFLYSGPPISPRHPRKQQWMLFWASCRRYTVLYSTLIKQKLFFAIWGLCWYNLLFCVSWKSKIRYPKTSYIWDIPSLWLDPRDWLPTSIHRLYTCCALFLNEVKSKGVLLVSCPQSFQEWYTDKFKASCFAKLQQVEWTLSSGM